MPSSLFPKAAPGERCGTKAAPPPPAKTSPTGTAPRAHPCRSWGQGEGPWPRGDSATPPGLCEHRAVHRHRGRGKRLPPHPGSGSGSAMKKQRMGRPQGGFNAAALPPPRAAPCLGQAAFRSFLPPSPQEPGFCPSGDGAMELHVARAPRKSLLAPARSGAPRAHSLFLSSFKLFPLCSLPFVPPLII